MAIKKKTQKKKEKQQALNNTRPIWQTWETTFALLYQRNVSNLKPKAEPKKKKKQPHASNGSADQAMTGLK
jgi:hypothetical protein